MISFKGQSILSQQQHKPPWKSIWIWNPLTNILHAIFWIMEVSDRKILSNAIGKLKNISSASTFNLSIVKGVFCPNIACSVPSKRTHLFFAKTTVICQKCYRWVTITHANIVIWEVKTAPLLVLCRSNSLRLGTWIIGFIWMHIECRKLVTLFCLAF